jgi:pilus assembly protein Flp/PilA
MEAIVNTLTRFVKNESAATAIEYGLIAFFIAAVIVVAVQSLGLNVAGEFTSVSTAFR